jgi:hypothetical protein
MITYFKVFVFLLFPPAAFLISLLIIPFPTRVTKQIIKLCDAVLFCQPHPYVPISLFWCVLILSFFTFTEMYLGLQSIREEYQSAKKAGNFDRSLAKLMAEERNVWISGSAFGLWVILHRYRSLLKKYHNILEEQQIGRQVIFTDFTRVESDKLDVERTPKNSIMKKNV